MRIRTLIATAFLLSASAACTASGAQPGGTPAPAESGDAAAAQRTWEARRPAAYAYDLAISCFCIHRGEYTVEVRNGAITSVRTRTVGASPEPPRVEYMMTVDQLFSAIREASQNGTPVRATYHAQWGYPTEAEIGTLANDAGTLYRIKNLRPL